MKYQTYACIVLGPLGKFQISQKVLDNYTRRIFKQRAIKELPMPDRVARHINDWGNKSKIKKYE